MEIIILLILFGIVFIVYGLCLKKNPELAWECSWERRRYVEDEDAPPTKRFLEYQKSSGIFCVVIGSLLVFFTILFLVFSIPKYTVEINGEELKLPCSYSDVQELGFFVESEQEIRPLEMWDSRTYVVVNDAGEEMKITFENDTDTEKAVEYCKITSIYVMAEDGPNFRLPNGVEFGMRESRVEDIMGYAGMNDNYEEIIGFKTYEISIGYYDTKDTNSYSGHSGSELNAFISSSANRDEEMSWIRVSLEKY